jgi:hypothetical protein
MIVKCVLADRGEKGEQADEEIPHQTEKLTDEADGEVLHQHSHARVDAPAEKTDGTDGTIDRSSRRQRQVRK